VKTYDGRCRGRDRDGCLGRDFGRFYLERLSEPARSQPRHRARSTSASRRGPIRRRASRFLFSRAARGNQAEHRGASEVLHRVSQWPTIVTSQVDEAVSLKVPSKWTLFRAYERLGHSPPVCRCGEMTA
jgi:hypothetical protein